MLLCFFFFFSSRRRHTRYWRDWSSDVCSSDLSPRRYREGLINAEASLVNFSRGSAVVSASLEKAVALQKLAEFDGTLRQTEATIAQTQQGIRVLQEEAESNSNRLTTQIRNSDDASLISQPRSNLLTV